MRRFYGYLILVVTTILIVLSGFQYQIRNVKSGLEYEGGFETVYKVDSKDSGLSLKQISSIIQQRVEDADVSNSSVEYEYGPDHSKEYDYIRVKLAADTEKDANYVLRSVEATGKITFSTVMDSGEHVKEIEEPLKLGSASVEWNGSTPYVSVSVKDAEEMNKFIETANKAYEEFNKDQEKKESDVKGLIVIWLDKHTDDSYYAVSKGSTTFSEVEIEEMKNRILTVVPTDNFVTEKAGDKYTKQVLNIKSYNYDRTNLVAKSAHTLERIFNYDVSNYKLTKLYTHRINATQSGGYTKLILIGMCVSALCLLGYLAFRFGLAGLGAWSGIIASLYLQLIIFNFFDYTFTTMVALGFLVSLIANGLFAIVYLDKFKDELHKGKSVSKANTEARKHSLVSIIDLTVLVVFIGTISVVSVSSQIKLLPATLIIGALTSLILNRLLTSIIMYFLCNNKLIENKKLLVGIRKKDVPDVNNLETQTKFNPLNKFEPKKYGKKVSLITGVLSSIAIVIIATFSIIAAVNPNVNLFKETNDTKEYTRIEIECQLVGTNYVFETKESAVEWFSQNYPRYKFTTDNVDIVVEKDVSVTGHEERVNMAYISISLNEVADYTYYNEEELEKKLIGIGKGDNINADVYTLAKQSNNFLTNSTIILATIFVSLSVAFVLVRYGYKYALSSLSVLLPTTLITYAIIVATRMQISSLSLVGVSVGLLVLTFIQLPIFEKIKKLRRESRTPVTTYEQVENISLEASRQTMFISLSIVLVTIVTTVIFMLFSPYTYTVLTTYALTLSTLILGLVLTLFLLIPSYLFFEKHLKIKMTQKRIEKNKKRMEKEKEKNKNKGSEARESIIPGIND